jgi:hypothetical protein
MCIYTYTCIHTEELQQQAGVFKRNANELKKKMWWKVCMYMYVCMSTNVYVYECVHMYMYVYYIHIYLIYMNQRNRCGGRYVYIDIYV